MRADPESPQARYEKAREQRRNKHLKLNGDLARLNEKFCVVLDGGKTRVLFFEEHAQQIGRGSHIRRVPTFLSFEDFRNFHCNKTLKHNGKIIPIGKWWLEHPGRRQYDGIIFHPNGDEIIGNRLNLWRGWGIEPIPGDCSLMKTHIRELLAGGIEVHYNYITNWLAWAVQHPAERAEVALVFRGVRGSGKGTLGNAMCRIFGQHATHLSSAILLAASTGICAMRVCCSRTKRIGPAIKAPRDR